MENILIKCAIENIRGFDSFLYALAVFVVIAYITGVITTAWEKKPFREEGLKEIFRKIIIFSLVAVGHIIDAYIIKRGSILRTAVIFFYLSNEGISILENAIRMELQVPEKLKEALEQLLKEKNKLFFKVQ